MIKIYIQRHSNEISYIICYEIWYPLKFIFHLNLIYAYIPIINCNVNFMCSLLLLLRSLKLNFFRDFGSGLSNNSFQNVTIIKSQSQEDISENVCNFADQFHWNAINTMKLQWIFLMKCEIRNFIEINSKALCSIHYIRDVIGAKLRPTLATDYVIDVQFMLSDKLPLTISETRTATGYFTFPVGDIDRINKPSLADVCMQFCL